MNDPPLEEMVEYVAWFVPADFEILRFFEEHDIRATAKVVAENIDYKRKYVNQRLNILADGGLFENDGGVFHLTDYGRAFLAGEIDPGDVEQPEP